MSGFAPDVMLNWLCRYVPLRDELQGAALDSLLEVGSGFKGLGCILSTPFVGVDIAFSHRPAAPMLPIAYDGTRLPFRPGAFHTVVSMDAMEHVPPAARAEFLLELTRVSAARVIIGCPVDAGGLAADVLLQDFYRAVHQSTPEWLFEHQTLGLPASQELERIFAAVPGWRFRELATPGGLAAMLLVLADFVPGMARWIQPALRQDPDKLAAWIQAADFGPKVRRVYLLERLEEGAPHVDLKIPETLIAAFVCPDCDSGLRNPPSGLACASCGRRFGTDNRGVWDFHAQFKRTRPQEPLLFELAPDWLAGEAWVPLVHNYLQAFAADDAVVLWLRVDTRVLSLEEAFALLRPVMAPFGERPFPTLELAEAGTPLPSGRAIALPPQGAEVWAWHPDRFRLARLMASTSPTLAR